MFVGGLSPLISEETLRTFFAPFGEIHYVKVPVGKHCGFVQFVRKADIQPCRNVCLLFSWGTSNVHGTRRYSTHQTERPATAHELCLFLYGLLTRIRV